jgi:hypothetical protein
MKLTLLALILVPASGFVCPQRAFTRSTTVANAQPSEQDLELTRQVIRDYIDNENSSAGAPSNAPQVEEEASKKKKSKKEAVTEAEE